MSGEPFPKSAQLARGERRSFRHKATKAEWVRIVWAKRGPCRACGVSGGVFLTYHHIVPRSLGGDDVEDNMVPLCGHGTLSCHGRVESRAADTLAALAASLTEPERAYVIAKLGEDGLRRLFGGGSS